MLPQGIFYLTDYDSTNEPPSSVITAPYVDGATLRLRWKTLEPTEGVFHWAALDAGLSKVAAAGKRAQLLVAAGQQSPTWLAAAGVKFYALGTANAVPVPWDPTFQTKLQAFITALSQRIANAGETALVQGVVATGIAQTTAETKLCSSGTSSCVTDTAGWTAVGYSRDNVKSAFSAILHMWQAAFPSAGISNRYTFDAFPQGFGGNIPDDMFPRELSSAGHSAFPAQYIMGYNGLDATTGISNGAGPGNLLPQMCPVGRTPNNLWGDCQPNRDVGFYEGLQENIQETNTFAGEWTQASNNLSHLLFIEVYPQGFTAANQAGLINAHNALTGGTAPTPTPTATPTPTPSPTPTATPTPSPTSTPTPSPTPTPTPTPTNTPTPVAGAHYSNMVAVIEENYNDRFSHRT